MTPLQYQQAEVFIILIFITMKICLCLLVLALGFINSIFPCYAIGNLPNITTVSQISQRGTHVKFSEICEFFKVNGMYPLPLDYNRNLYPAMYRNKKVSRHGFAYFIKDSPFYVNVNRKDTTHNDRETSIKNLFEKSNGDYVLGVVFTKSGDHNAEKFWLSTFNSWGEAIDYIPIAMSFNNTYWIIEGQVNTDLTVNVQELEFSGYDYILDVNTHEILENLKGQRVDRTYKITPEGKFELTAEIKFRPQIYTGEMMKDKTKPIIKGKEKR